MLAGFYSTHAQGPFVQGSRISYNQFTNRQHLDANFWVRVGQDSERESFVTNGRTGRALEGARILTGRIGFGKGSGELFLIRFAGTDQAVPRCPNRGGV